MRLLKLTLKNFKGFRDATFEFNEQNNIVYGKNGSGKTTIFDAYSWLMFDKDSEGKSDFGIKTNDVNGNVIPNQDHSVEGIFLMPNGDKLTLKKVLVENWGTDKDSMKPILKNNEIEYWWNNAHITMGKYKNLLAAIVDDNILKVLSDPMYFSSTKFGWKNRRELIVQIANLTETDKDLMKGKFDELAKRLSAYKDLNMLQAETKNEISQLKKKIEVEIPIQIKTITEGITGEELSLAEMTEKKLFIERQIAQINKDIETASNNGSLEAIKSISGDKIRLQAAISDMEFTAKNEILKKLREREQELAELENQISLIKKEITRLNSEVTANNMQQQEMEAENATLRLKYHDIWSEELVFDGFSCPTCGREYEPEKLAQEKAKSLTLFEGLKQSRLQKINIKGKANKEAIEKIKGVVNDLKDQVNIASNILKEKEEELVQLKASKVGVETSQAILDRNEDYKYAIAKMAEIDAQLTMLSEQTTEDATTALKNQRAILQKDVENIVTTIQQINRAAEDRLRIGRLEGEIKTLGQTRADLEKTEIQINDFNKYKVSLIDSKISAIFPNVRFKMFEIQINGGMDDNHCTTMLGGVPWPDLNTAGRINAGLEIISVLQNRYGIAPPIFIDNRESVTEIYKTSAQVISLVVSPSHETLTLE